MFFIFSHSLFLPLLNGHNIYTLRLSCFLDILFYSLYYFLGVVYFCFGIFMLYFSTNL